ncbi:MAG: hypothetical protein ACOX3L_12080 [Lutisporaceae bacterium]
MVNLRVPVQGMNMPRLLKGKPEWEEAESMVYLNFNTPVKLLSHNLADSDYGISVPTTISANGIYTHRIYGCLWRHL